MWHRIKINTSFQLLTATKDQVIIILASRCAKLETLKLSNIEQEQYLDGRHLGNSGCCWHRFGNWCCREAESIRPPPHFVVANPWWPSEAEQPTPVIWFLFCQRKSLGSFVHWQDWAFLDKLIKTQKGLKPSSADLSFDLKPTKSRISNGRTKSSNTLIKMNSYIWTVKFFIHLQGLFKFVHLCMPSVAKLYCLM